MLGQFMQVSIDVAILESNASQHAVIEKPLFGSGSIFFS